MEKSKILPTYLYSIRVVVNIEKSLFLCKLFTINLIYSGISFLDLIQETKLKKNIK